MLKVPRKPEACMKGNGEHLGGDQRREDQEGPQHGGSIRLTPQASTSVCRPWLPPPESEGGPRCGKNKNVFQLLKPLLECSKECICWVFEMLLVSSLRRRVKNEGQLSRYTSHQEEKNASLSNSQ